VTGSSTDIFALNHSGYAQNMELLTDVGRLIGQNAHPPDVRFTKLKRAQSARGIYWRYGAADSTSP